MLFQSALNSICTEYESALNRLTGRAVRECRLTYPPFDVVFSNYEYACGYATKQEFFK